MEVIEKRQTVLHTLFETGVVIKGIHGLIELVGAVFIYVTSGTTLLSIITRALSEELTEDPNDFLANLLVQHAQVSAAQKDFAALYLFVGAVTNLAIAVGLLMRRRSMFPAAIGILSVFAGYQMYLYTRTLSPWLAVLALYDCIVIYLVFAEYRRQKSLDSVISDRYTHV